MWECHLYDSLDAERWFGLIIVHNLLTHLGIFLKTYKHLIEYGVVWTLL